MNQLADMPRDRYRKALGVKAGQDLIVIYRSTLDRYPTIAASIIGALPVDEFRIVFVPGPALEHGDPQQLHSCLAQARHSGLVVMPSQDWRSAVIAADAVICDPGAVAIHAAALGRSVVLIPPAGQAHDQGPLGRAAVAFNSRACPDSLLIRAYDRRARTTAAARELVHTSGAVPASRPGSAEPQPEPGRERPALWVHAGGGPDGGVHVHRLPADTADRTDLQDDRSRVLSVWDDEPNGRLRSLASVMLSDRPAGERTDTWAREMLETTFLYCVVCYTPTEVVAYTRQGHQLGYRIHELGVVDPALVAAIVYAARYDMGVSALLHGAAQGRVPVTIRAGITAPVTLEWVSHGRWR
jgi:hypothetical protein